MYAVDMNNAEAAVFASSHMTEHLTSSYDRCAMIRKPFEAISANVVSYRSNLSPARKPLASVQP